MIERKIASLLKKYLISDIVNIIFDFAWFDNSHLNGMCYILGDYERYKEIDIDDLLDIELQSALYASCLYGWKNMFLLTLNKIYKSDKCRDLWHYTLQYALSEACMGKNYNIAQMLIKRGALVCLHHKLNDKKCIRNINYKK